jgi:excisionase family DNA binding protein
MESLNFEQLPSVVADLKKEVIEMKALIIQQGKPQQTNNPINIQEVAKLTGLSVPTLYGYCQRGEIPFNKKGNRSYFFRNEIIDWIKEGKRKTKKGIENDVEDFLSNKKGKK